MDTREERVRKAFATLMDIVGVDFQPNELHSTHDDDIKKVTTHIGTTVQVYGHSTQITGDNIPEIFISVRQNEEVPGAKGKRADMSICIGSTWYYFKEDKLIGRRID